MPAHPRESELIAAAVAGDSRAFDELMGAHRDRLWGVCLRVTAHRADAEDALQECLLAVWKNLGRFRGEAQFSTWLYRIASNAALAVVRRSRELTAEIPEREDVSVRFEEDLADRDRIQRALRLLPEDFRVALVLREYGDFTYEQIAEHQGVLVATVKTRINRARTHLRTVLAASDDVAAG